MYSKYIKPFFDITMAVIALILLSPIFFLTALILTISNGCNPFFLQSRPGLNEKIFLVIKFKTMNNKKDEQGNDVQIGTFTYTIRFKDSQTNEIYTYNGRVSLIR